MFALKICDVQFLVKHLAYSRYMSKTVNALTRFEYIHYCNFMKLSNLHHQFVLFLRKIIVKTYLFVNLKKNVLDKVSRTVFLVAEAIEITCL